MAKYAKGDHVSWNSEAGRVSGRIIAVHERDFDYKGHCHRASKDDPQYEIKSDRTDHIAAHKEARSPGFHDARQLRSPAKPHDTATVAIEAPNK